MFASKLLPPSSAPRHHCPSQRRTRSQASLHSGSSRPKSPISHLQSQLTNIDDRGRDDITRSVLSNSDAVTTSHSSGLPWNPLSAVFPPPSITKIPEQVEAILAAAPVLVVLRVYVRSTLIIVRVSGQIQKFAGSGTSALTTLGVHLSSSSSLFSVSITTT